MPSAAEAPDLLIELQRGPGTRSVTEQLHAALMAAIGDGRLPAGSWLPSTRRLAAEQRISRGVVVGVYERLAEEGLVRTQRGSGSRVVGGGASPVVDLVTSAGRVVHDLRPGAPDLTLFPRAAWEAATAAVLRGMSAHELGYIAPWGDGTLRKALAAHVAQSRGIMATPRDVVVTTGTTQALTLACRVLRSAGHTTLAVEDPDNVIHRRILGAQGLRLVDVPIDDEGIDVGVLWATGARAVVVTPAHQYPWGVVMSAARRRQLVTWARTVDGLIIEDDYDAVFAPAEQRMPSLRTLAVDHVLHTASVSKSLAPALRLGWAVPPPHLLAGLKGAKRDDDFGGAALTQRTFAHLLTNGAYHRHVRRIRGLYQERRAALSAAVHRYLPDWRIVGADTGLHLCVMAPQGIDDQAVVDLAASRGVLALALSGLRRGAGPAGLVLGHARLPVDVAGDAVAGLATAVDDLARRTRPPARTRFPLPSRALAARLGTTAIDYFPGGLDAD